MNTRMRYSFRVIVERRKISTHLSHLGDAWGGVEDFNCTFFGSPATHSVHKNFCINFFPFSNAHFPEPLIFILF